MKKINSTNFTPRFCASGYVLMTTMLFMSMLSALVMGVALRVMVSRNAIRLSHMSEQARFLAYDGIEIVRAQLQYDPEAQKQKEEKKDEQKHQELANLLRYLNRWQTFTFTEKKDGFAGELKIYITAEEGKLNLNNLYDFKRKKFQPDLKKLLARFAFEKSSVSDSDQKFVPSLKELLKKQSYPLEDVTQLLAHEAFKPLAPHFFLHPDRSSHEKKNNKQVTISDIFTVADTAVLEPLFFSRSVQKALDLHPLASEPAKREEQIKKITHGLTSSIKWQESWDKVLQPIFKKNYKDLPKEYTKRFGTASRARFISVLCYGKIGDITQCASALLQRLEEDGKVSFIVQKIYWL